MLQQMESTLKSCSRRKSFAMRAHLTSRISHRNEAPSYMLMVLCVRCCKQQSCVSQEFVGKKHTHAHARTHAHTHAHTHSLTHSLTHALVSKAYKHFTPSVCFAGSVKDKGEVMNIFNQMLEGVEYIHGKGVIHRDLKVIASFLYFLKIW